MTVITYVICDECGESYSISDEAALDESLDSTGWIISWNNTHLCTNCKGVVYEGATKSEKR